MLSLRGTSSSQWEGEWAPPRGPYTRALHRRGSAAYVKEGGHDGQSLHTAISHIPQPAAQALLPLTPDRRVCLAGSLH